MPRLPELAIFLITSNVMRHEKVKSCQKSQFCFKVKNQPDNWNYSIIHFCITWVISARAAAGGRQSIASFGWGGKNFSLWKLCGHLGWSFKTEKQLRQIIFLHLCLSNFLPCLSIRQDKPFSEQSSITQ